MDAQIQQAFDRVQAQNGGIIPLEIAPFRQGVMEALEGRPNTHHDVSYIAGYTVGERWRGQPPNGRGRRRMRGGAKSDAELIRIAKQIHGEDYAHLPEADFVRGFIIGWRRLPSPDKYRDDDSFQTGVQVAQIQSPDSESDSDSASSGDMGDGDLASESDDDDEHKSGSGRRRIDFYGRARPHFCE